MTKLVVGDSTGNSVLISGIAVLYMNYVFEVKAGCCLKLENCRLHKYSQSFEINHHRNINKAANIRDGINLLIQRFINSESRQQFQTFKDPNVNGRKIHLWSETIFQQYTFGLCQWIGKKKNNQWVDFNAQTNHCDYVRRIKVNKAMHNRRLHRKNRGRFIKLEKENINQLKWYADNKKR